jgi:hypothetical protein
MIYVDHNATTPVLPEVLEAIKVYSRQLTVKAFSILIVNCRLWTVDCELPCLAMQGCNFLFS